MTFASQWQLHGINFIFFFLTGFIVEEATQSNKNFRAKKKEKDAQKPIPKPKSGKELNKSKQIIRHFVINRYELYWVKLRGYAAWPGVVESQEGSNLFKIHFFGDNTTSIVTRSCILSTFIVGFVDFQENPKPNHKLLKAVKMASIYYTPNKIPSKCSVCVLKR